MVYETTLLWETEIAIPFTCANGTGIDKGTVCQLTDPATASAHSGANQTFCGIVKVEKIASDGMTQIAIYRGGHFRMRISGNVTVGDALALDSNVNTVKTAVSANLGGDIVGTALETGTTGEYIRVEVRPSPQIPVGG